MNHRSSSFRKFVMFTLHVIGENKSRKSWVFETIENDRSIVEKANYRCAKCNETKAHNDWRSIVDDIIEQVSMRGNETNETSDRNGWIPLMETMAELFVVVRRKIALLRRGERKKKEAWKRETTDYRYRRECVANDLSRVSATGI